MMEHRIQIPNIDPEETEECPPSPLTSQFQTHTSPRRRFHPFSDAIPNTPPAFVNNHHYHNHNNHRTMMGVRVRLFRFLGPRRDMCTLAFYAISILVIIGFFLIWWFTPRVAIIKDARIVEISSILKPFSLNDTEINLSRNTVLAVASANPNI